MHNSMPDNDLARNTAVLTSFDARRAGFTIIELIVVIGIITVLIGLLMPGLRAIRLSADRTTESNAARQLMVGYHAYANANRGRVLTGFPPSKGLEAYDQSGNPISQTGPLGNPQPVISMKRYPWRLAPYLDYNFRGLYTNQMRDKIDEYEQEQYGMYIYLSSLYPSLGLNTQWIGGDHSANGYAFLPGGSGGPLNPASLLGRFWVETVSEVRRPEQLLVFTSARAREFSDGVAVGPVIEGYYRVLSPRFSDLADSERWSPNEYSKASEPADYGFVSLRHSGQAVTAFMDGHVGLLNESELRDMRHWANQADHRDWTLPLNLPNAP